MDEANDRFVDYRASKLTRLYDISLPDAYEIAKEELGMLHRIAEETTQYMVKKFEDSIKEWKVLGRSENSN